jgi:hypothetical protein
VVGPQLSVTGSPDTDDMLSTAPYLQPPQEKKYAALTQSCQATNPVEDPEQPSQPATLNHGNKAMTGEALQHQAAHPAGPLNRCFNQQTLSLPLLPCKERCACCVLALTGANHWAEQQPTNCIMQDDLAITPTASRPNQPVRTIHCVAHSNGTVFHVRWVPEVTGLAMMYLKSACGPVLLATPLS